VNLSERGFSDEHFGHGRPAENELCNRQRETATKNKKKTIGEGLSGNGNGKLVDGGDQEKIKGS
jgi:hypothetical protein